MPLRRRWENAAAFGGMMGLPTTIVVAPSIRPMPPGSIKYQNDERGSGTALSLRRAPCSPVPFLAHDERLDAGRIERQPQGMVEVLEQFHYLRYQPGIKVLVNLDRIVRKLILQIAHEHHRVIPHHDRANQFLGHGDDD